MKKLISILTICIFTVFTMTACTVTMEDIDIIGSSSSGKRSFNFASDVDTSVKTSKSKSQVETSKEGEKSLSEDSLVESSTEDSSTKNSLSNSESSSKSSSINTSSSKSSSKTSSKSSIASSSVSSGNNTPSTQATVDVMVDASVSSNGTTVDGVKTYKTVTAALNAISGENKTIGIKKGTYKEKLTIPASLKNLTLIGDSTGETKLTYGDCSSMVGDSTDASASVTVLAEGFSAKNIHFENSYDYLGGSEKNKQALALYIKSDRSTFYSCVFTGHQDTLEVVSGRYYFYDCTIKGSVDFIFGNNPSILFEGCEIVSRNRNSSNGGYITAMKGNNGTNGSGVATYGLVFKGCDFTAESGVKSGSVSLGRPWRADATVTFMNCSMGAHLSTKAYDGSSGKCRYVYMNGGNLKNEPQNAYFTEYNNTGSGAITSAVKGCTMLTDSQAQKYTISNIFAKTNGSVKYSTDFNAENALNTLIELYI